MGIEMTREEHIATVEKLLKELKKELREIEIEQIEAARISYGDY